MSGFAERDVETGLRRRLLGHRQTKSMVTPFFATLIFDSVVWLA